MPPLQMPRVWPLPPAMFARITLLLLGALARPHLPRLPLAQLLASHGAVVAPTLAATPALARRLFAALEPPESTNRSKQPSFRMQRQSFNDRMSNIEAVAGWLSSPREQEAGRIPVSCRCAASLVPRSSDCAFVVRSCCSALHESGVKSHARPSASFPSPPSHPLISRHHHHRPITITTTCTFMNEAQPSPHPQYLPRPATSNQTPE
jgi:hypothetical protein